MNKKIYLLILFVLLSGCSKPPEFPALNHSSTIAMETVPTEIAVTQDGINIYLLDFYEMLYNIHLETGMPNSVTQMQKELPADAYIQTETEDFIFKTDPAADELVITRKADQETKRIATGRNPQLITLTPDKTKLLVTNHEDQAIYVYDLS